MDDAGKPIVDELCPCHCGHVLADHGDADPRADECFSLPCMVVGCGCDEFLANDDPEPIAEADAAERAAARDAERRRERP